MGTWNSAYELNPQNFKNPGEGAFHFRDLKTNIRLRGAKELIWGEDEATLGVSGGLHKEGSARTFVKDGAETNRPAEEILTTDTTRPGRTVVSTALLGALRQQDGVDLQNVAGYSYKDQREQKIAINTSILNGSTGVIDNPSDPTATEEFVVFDYDKLVDIIQDQVIKGIKAFESSPQVPNVAAGGSPSVEEGWKDYITTPPTTDPNAEAAVNVTEAYDVHERSKLYNIFDPLEEDNIPARITDTNSPDGYVMPYSIRASDIYGTTVRGAVYG